MKIAQKYILKHFIPVCALALLFFVLMLELADLFANLFKYLSNEVSIKDVLLVSYYHFPKCIVFSLPIAVLFASAYSLGNLYSSFELTAFFTSGISLLKLVFPLIIIGIGLSFFIFLFEDNVAYAFTYNKTKLQKELTNEEESLSNNSIILISDAGRIVYSAEYYQDSTQKLYDLLVVVRDEQFHLKKIIETAHASWTGEYWQLETPKVYDFSKKELINLDTHYQQDLLIEKPELFRKNIQSVNELSIKDARVFINNLKKAGYPVNEHVANYYKRFSFSLTVFIVLLFSISLGGRFKKNIILMSLLLSFSLAVLFYVTQMITMLFAKWGYISPLAGAWFPILLYIFIGIFLLYFART